MLTSEATEAICQDKETNITCDTISLITYNIWYDKFNQHNRFKAICEIFSDYTPEFICIQECTPEMLHLLNSSTFFTSNYFIYSPPIYLFDVLILSKFKAKKHYVIDLPSDLNRKLLCIELVINGKTTIVATVHLERSESPYFRIEQLKKCFDHLDNFEYAYLLGDFNFDKTQEEQFVHSSFKDLWLEHKEKHNLPDSAGVTRPKEKEKFVRFDRIYYKGDYKSLSEFLLLGNEPVELDVNEKNKLRIITPSDHLGVYAELSL